MHSVAFLCSMKPKPSSKLKVMFAALELLSGSYSFSYDLAPIAAGVSSVTALTEVSTVRSDKSLIIQF